jgi:hypothetical protein
LAPNVDSHKLLHARSSSIPPHAHLCLTASSAPTPVEQPKPQTRMGTQNRPVQDTHGAPSLIDEQGYDSESSDNNTDIDNGLPTPKGTLFIPNLQ